MKPTSKPRLPDPGPLDLNEKKLCRIGVACSGELKEAVRADARSLGITVSEHFARLAHRRIQMQRATGERGKRDPLLATIDALRGEAKAALSDGGISSGERAAMTVAVSDVLHRLWGRRSA